MNNNKDIIEEENLWLKECKGNNTICGATGILNIIKADKDKPTLLEHFTYKQYTDYLNQYNNYPNTNRNE